MQIENNYRPFQRVTGNYELDKKINKNHSRKAKLISLQKTEVP